MGKMFNSFRIRFIGLTLLMVMGAQIATAMAVLVKSARNANEQAAAQMESGIQTFRSIISNRGRMLEQSIRPLAADKEFKRAVVSSDYTLVGSELATRLDWIDGDTALLLDADGRALVQAGQPLPEGARLRKLIEQTRTALTLDDRSLEMMTMPLETAAGNYWLSIGFLVNDRLAEELATITGLQMTFIAGRDAGKIRVLGSSLPESERNLITDASAQIAGGANLEATVAKLGTRYLSDREYFLPEGDEIFVVVQKPLLEAMAGYEALRASILHAATMAIGCALLAAFLLSRALTRPIYEILLAARRIGEGDYATKLGISSKDELGELAGAFETMRQGIAAREQQISYQAQYDSLTGLPNRQRGTELLREKLRESRRTSQPLAIFVMHLQRFREIQSSLGHEIGDEVLRQTAVRLQNSISPEEVIAHLEGDQFLFIVPDCDSEAALSFAAKLTKLLDAGLSVQRVNVTLDACIGLCIAPEHGLQPDQLLRRATVAKNDAAQTPGRVRIYQNGREARHVRQLAILGDLRRAVEESELQIYVQPKISLGSTQVCGAEALVRWQHAELGQISPNEFIPLAENAGSITMITNWVIREAVRQCSLWKAAGADLPIAVNLSGRDLVNPELVQMIRAILEEFAMPANCLTLEITEEAVVQDIDSAIEVLEELRKLGCHLSMDDFGTGYSSLAHLQKLPVDELKIDRTFVTHLPDSRQNTAIVRSVIELAHNLNLEVVAEGVETTAALRWLREEGCERAQGFYLSRPMPAEEFIPWLRNWDSLAAADDGATCTTDSLILRPRLIVS